MGGDTAIATGAGAYVFTRSGTMWTQQAKLIPEPGDSLAGPAALDGDTALIGNGGLRFSPVYVFKRNGTDWSQYQKLNVTGNCFAELFGASVALSGNMALVGALGPIFNFGSLCGHGTTYVFVLTNGVWNQTAQLAVEGGWEYLGSGDYLDTAFGSSVALSGNTALIGASSYDTPAGHDAGNTTVFVLGDTDWSPQQTLTALDIVTESDKFGASLALDGDTVLIGAPGTDTPANTDSRLGDPRSAYVFVRNGSTWQRQAKLTAESAGRSTGLGFSVALSGNTAVVGAFTSATFSVTATGYAPLHYQWRKNGFEITGANETSYSIAAAALLDTGAYDVVVYNIGGVVTSAQAMLVVNNLAPQTTPSPTPSALGSLRVTLIPTGINSGWRFVGEQQWRASAVTVAGLTSGDRQIEFRPVAGYIQPLREAVAITGGGTTTLLIREYYQTTSGSGGGVVVTGSGVGGLTVVLKPDSIAALSEPVATRAQWRITGETAWRNSNTTIGTRTSTGLFTSGLLPGVYLIECKPVTGRTTPIVSVAVQAGQPRLATLTYSQSDATTGTPPEVLQSFATVTTPPYCFVGQIRSDFGSGTGFVVSQRVVATAGHVVFDDGTLTYVTGLQWLFQRYSGSYEPTPQLPHGFYVFAGYAAQRTAEATPGDSSTASRNLDVAALYFRQDAGRGGYSGYLATDSMANEFLTSSQLKMLVGYPVDGAAAPNQGRMFATTPSNVHFSPVPGYPRLYTTSIITSYGGNSGGPLFVKSTNNSYYPAAIYLGGSNQTVVRTIDAQVVDLFDRAEASGTNGGSSTGGGIIHVETPVSGDTFAAAGLKVNFLPAAAASATWKIGPNGSSHTGGGMPLAVGEGGVTLYFSTVAGFLAPPSYPLTLVKGNLYTITRIYFGITGQPQNKTVSRGANAIFSVGISEDTSVPATYQWRRNGVNIAGATGKTYTKSSVTTADNGSKYSAVVKWGSDGSQTSNNATLTVNSQSVVRTDFDQNGRPDFVLTTAARATKVLYLNGTTLAGSAVGPTLPANTSLVSVNDFNNDHKPDFVLFNPATRQTLVWYFNGVTPSGNPLPVPMILPVGWALQATADFNADGKLDYILFNASTRQTAIWYLNGTVFSSGVYGPTLPPGWALSAVEDLNNDTKPDFLLTNASSGRTALWYLTNNGRTLAGSVYGPNLPVGWKIVGSENFDGDNKADWILFQPTTRQTAVWYMNGPVRLSSHYAPTLEPGYDLIGR